MELSDLNIDPIKGTEVLTYIGIHPADISDPVKFTRLREVAQYFQHAEDARYLITKLLTGKNVDKIDHLWNYVTLRKEHLAHQQKLSKLKEELSIFES